MTDGTDDVPGTARAPEDTARGSLDHYWDDFLGLEPLFATLVGDERFDDRLPDPSPDGLGRRESVDRSALRVLEGIERHGLGLEDRTALDMLEAVARRELAILEHRLDPGSGQQVQIVTEQVEANVSNRPARARTRHAPLLGRE